MSFSTVFSVNTFLLICSEIEVNLLTDSVLPSFSKLDFASLTLLMQIVQAIYHHLEESL